MAAPINPLILDDEPQPRSSSDSANSTWEAAYSWATSDPTTLMTATHPDISGLEPYWANIPDVSEGHHIYGAAPDPASDAARATCNASAHYFSASIVAQS